MHISINNFNYKHLAGKIVASIVEENEFIKIRHCNFKKLSRCHNLCPFHDIRKLHYVSISYPFF